jgi:hypothetical protein
MSLPTVIVNDFYLEVVRGNVTGYTAKELLGINAAIGETEDVWNQGGSITQVSTAAVLYVSSSAAADHHLIVTINGLDANYDEITEVISMTLADARTPKAGVKSFLRVNSATIDSAPAGDVYVYYTGDNAAGVPTDATDIQAKIAATTLRAYNAIYTVPRNKNWYMTSLRYRSTGAAAAFNVILSVIRKIYGGSNETVKIVKYLDLGTTNFVDAQIQMTDHPVLFPAKSEIRITGGLAGGTDLNLTVDATFVQEDIAAVPNNVDVLSMGAFLAKMATNSKHNHTQDFWLIGLDAVPTAIPLVANLDNVLTTITGSPSVADVGNYTVAKTTTVAFDPSYFVGYPSTSTIADKLLSTTKKAVFTIMRCVDDAGGIDWVQAPVNTIVNLGNIKKVNYLHN